MKKLLAIILSAILIFSCMTVTASAAGNIIGELATDLFERITGTKIEEDTPLGYGVFYENDNLSGISLIYKPKPDIEFTNPGTYTITNDTPLAVDYELVCWEDSEGNTYYPGDKIFVDGQITLYAVWTEKTDDDVKVVRILKTTIEALRRLVDKFLSVFKIVTDFNDNFVPTAPETPRYIDLACSNIYYEKGVTDNIYIYIDSEDLYKADKNTVRIEDNGDLTCTVYFCTGWHEATLKPLNQKVYENVPYSFSDMQGAKQNDIIIIEDAATYDAEYINGLAEDVLAEDDEYYMIVTIGDAEHILYTQPAPYGDRVYPIYSNPLSCAFTLTK